MIIDDAVIDIAAMLLMMSILPLDGCHYRD